MIFAALFSPSAIYPEGRAIVWLQNICADIRISFAVSVLRESFSGGGYRHWRSIVYFGDMVA